MTERAYLVMTKEGLLTAVTVKLKDLKKVYQEAPASRHMNQMLRK